MPSYLVRKDGTKWIIDRTDMPCRIGAVKSRAEALNIARLLAGWRGEVITIGRRK